jgi:hypothetical protein
VLKQCEIKFRWSGKKMLARSLGLELAGVAIVVIGPMLVETDVERN